MTFGYSSDIYLSIVADTGYLPSIGHAEVLAKILTSEISELRENLSRIASVVDPETRIPSTSVDFPA